MQEPSYATFAPAAFAAPIDSLVPAQVPQHSTADFDSIKRTFASSSSELEKKQRYASVPANHQYAPHTQSPSREVQQQMLLQQEGGLVGGTGGYANGYGAQQQVVSNGYLGGYGAGAPSFVPQAQVAQMQAQVQAAAAAAAHQQQLGGSQGGNSPINGFSHPSSPYLSPNPNAIPFGSPSSQSNGGFPLPGQPQSYNGSQYSGHFDTMPSSPNPYAQGPYNNYNGLGFAGPPFMGMPMAPGMMAMGSPSLGGQMPLQQQGMGGGYNMPYQMMSPVLGMAPNSLTSARTVYVGNLPSDASVDELLSQVRFGPIDCVKILPEKSCAFLSFLDPTTAAAFHSDALMRKIRLHEQDLKIGWGKPSAVAANVLLAVQQSGATRNVYLGNLDESVTEVTLREDLSRFGPIDQVKIVRDKNIGFVHFLSIATAIKVVQCLSTEPEWAGRRVNYGKDRCAYVPKNQHQQQQHNLAAAAMGSMAANYNAAFASGFGNNYNGGEMGMGRMQGGEMDPNSAPGNRTVYLGNIHPETTTEEICNTIRGGILQQIRYIADKHICFVTFVDAQCALAFYQSATFQGLALHNRRLKVGWGKHSGPPSPGIAMVVQSGGSRNVYIGNIEDFDLYSEDRLRNDFGEYGEIELVNTLREKQCAFVNFCALANAIKAIEGIKANPDYSTLKIAYGKDRCGNPPRGPGFGAQNYGMGMMRSPYIDGGFPEVVVPISTTEFDPTIALDFNSLALTDGEGTAGALVFDEHHALLPEQQ